MIYFVYAPELNKVKIGVSKYPQSRMSYLQVGSPTQLRLLETMWDGGETFGISDKEIEEMLHKHFDGLRSHGEWFEYTGELKEMIESIDEVRLVFAKSPHKFITYIPKWMMEEMAGRK